MPFVILTILIYIILISVEPLISIVWFALAVIVKFIFFTNHQKEYKHIPAERHL